MTLTTTKPITALYTIYIEKQTNVLHIKNSEASFSAEIYLDQGASLQSLKFGNHHIIQNMAPLSYNKTYASSILFPFANRIKDGNYQFEGNTYSEEKLILDDRKNTPGTSQLKDNPSLKIQDKQFDDCWILSTDEVLFKTPNYNLKFNATGHNNFLQIYTPPRKNTIAIEPTTGIPDSFNNKIGLETLSPGDTHAITWQVQLTDN